MTFMLASFISGDDLMISFSQPVYGSIQKAAVKNRTVKRYRRDRIPGQHGRDRGAAYTPPLTTPTSTNAPAKHALVFTTSSARASPQQANADSARTSSASSSHASRSA